MAEEVAKDEMCAATAEQPAAADADTKAEAENKPSEETQESKEQPAPESPPKSPPGPTSTYQSHKLVYYEWKPSGDIKALMFICHGASEHMGRYDQLITSLTSNGILVFGQDLVGHGQSEGVRTDITNFDFYVQDILVQMEKMKEQYPSLPLFLFGHSMGGLVSCGAAINKQSLFSGLILSAPALAIDVGSIVKLGARFLSFLAPQFGVRTIQPSVISSIPEEVAAYRDDKLNHHGPLKARFSVSLGNYIDVVMPRLGTLKMPLLVLYGSDDTLVPTRASILAHSNITSTDKTLTVFEGSHHEVFHDKEAERARNLVVEWTLARLEGPVKAPTPPPPEVSSQPLEEPTPAEEEPSGKDKETAAAIASAAVSSAVSTVTADTEKQETETKEEEQQEQVKEPQEEQETKEEPQEEQETKEEPQEEQETKEEPQEEQETKEEPQEEQETKEEPQEEQETKEEPQEEQETKEEPQEEQEVKEEPQEEPQEEQEATEEPQEEKKEETPQAETTEEAPQDTAEESKGEEEEAASPEATSPAEPEQ